MIVELRDIRFHSKHGLYAEETASGGEFLINMNIHFSPLNEIIQHIGETVNYVEVYRIISEKMNIAEALLEKLAYSIALDVLNHDSKIQSVDIELFKLHPPIIQFNGKVGVKLTVQK